MEGSERTPPTSLSLYEIRFKPAVKKELAKLEKDVQVRIAKKICGLAENPRPDGVKKLSSKDSVYRVRVGRYRILYQILDEELVILVVQIGDRREVYR